MFSGLGVSGFRVFGFGGLGFGFWVSGVDLELVFEVP